MIGLTSTAFGTPSSRLATSFPPLVTVVERLLLVLTTRNCQRPTAAEKNGVAVRRASSRSTPSLQAWLQSVQETLSVISYDCHMVTLLLEPHAPLSALRYVLAS